MTFQEELRLLLIGVALGVVVSALGAFVTAGINHRYWKEREKETRDRELRQILGRFAGVAMTKDDSLKMDTILEDLDEFGLSSKQDDLVQLDRDFFRGMVEEIIDSGKDKRE